MSEPCERCALRVVPGCPDCRAAPVGSAGSEAAPDARPPLNFPPADFAVTRSVGALHRWGDRVWAWTGAEWMDARTVGGAGDTAPDAPAAALARMVDRWREIASDPEGPGEYEATQWVRVASRAVDAGAREAMLGCAEELAAVLAGGAEQPPATPLAVSPRRQPPWLDGPTDGALHARIVINALRACLDARRRGELASPDGEQPDPRDAVVRAARDLVAGWAAGHSVLEDMDRAGLEDALARCAPVGEPTPPGGWSDDDLTAALERLVPPVTLPEVRQVVRRLAARPDGERPAGPADTPAPGVPADGHTWEVTVRSRGAFGSPDGTYHDADWWSEHHPVQVRAWDLHAGLDAVRALPIEIWWADTDDEETPDA